MSSLSACIPIIAIIGCVMVVVAISVETGPYGSPASCRVEPMARFIEGKVTAVCYCKGGKELDGRSACIIVSVKSRWGDETQQMVLSPSNHAIMTGDGIRIEQGQAYWTAKSGNGPRGCVSDFELELQV